DRRQRLAALRAGAGSDPANLRIHRAGVLGPGRRLGDRGATTGVEVAFRVLPELLEATRIAEVVALAAVLVLPAGVRGVDRHPADRINRLLRRGRDCVVLTVEVVLRILLELLETARISEVVGLPTVLVLSRRVRGIDGHPADGIDRLGRR